MKLFDIPTELFVVILGFVGIDTKFGNHGSLEIVSILTPPTSPMPFLAQLRAGIYANDYKRKLCIGLYFMRLLVRHNRIAANVNPIGNILSAHRSNTLLVLHKLWNELEINRRYTECIGHKSTQISLFGSSINEIYRSDLVNHDIFNVFGDWIRDIDLLMYNCVAHAAIFDNLGGALGSNVLITQTKKSNYPDLFESNRYAVLFLDNLLRVHDLIFIDMSTQFIDKHPTPLFTYRRSLIDLSDLMYSTNKHFHLPCIRFQARKNLISWRPNGIARVNQNFVKKLINMHCDDPWNIIKRCNIATQITHANIRDFVFQHSDVVLLDIIKCINDNAIQRKSTITKEKLQRVYIKAQFDVPFEGTSKNTTYFNEMFDRFVISCAQIEDEFDICLKKIVVAYMIDQNMYFDMNENETTSRLCEMDVLNPWVEVYNAEITNILCKCTPSYEHKVGSLSVQIVFELDMVVRNRFYTKWSEEKERIVLYNAFESERHFLHKMIKRKKET